MQRLCTNSWGQRGAPSAAFLRLWHRSCAKWPAAQSERPYAVQVQVKTFDVQRAYNRTEIVFRRDRYELHRDPLHSWITRPGDLFTDAVQQYLRQADLFTYVGGDRDFYDRRPDYVLSGVVKAVERFDSGDVWAAHLAMSMELVRQEDA